MPVVALEPPGDSVPEPFAEPTTVIPTVVPDVVQNQPVAYGPTRYAEL